MEDKSFQEALAGALHRQEEEFGGKSDSLLLAYCQVGLYQGMTEAGLRSDVALEISTLLRNAFEGFKIGLTQEYSHKLGTLIGEFGSHTYASIADEETAGHMTGNYAGHLAKKVYEAWQEKKQIKEELLGNG